MDGSKKFLEDKSNEKLEAERQELVQKLERKSSEVAELKDKVTKLKDILTVVVDSESALWDKVDELRLVQINIEYKEKIMQKEKKLLQGQIALLEEKLNANEELFISSPKKRSSVWTLQNKLELMEIEKKHLHRQISFLKEQLSAQKEQLRTYQKLKECRELEFELKNKEAELKISQNQESILKTEIERLQKYVEDLKEKLGKSVSACEAAFCYSQKLFLKAREYLLRSMRKISQLMGDAEQKEKKFFEEIEDLVRQMAEYPAQEEGEESTTSQTIVVSQASSQQSANPNMPSTSQEPSSSSADTNTAPLKCPSSKRRRQL